MMTDWLTENEVVRMTDSWLVQQGFQRLAPPRLNRRKGDDVSVVGPEGTKLFVECKGAVSEKGRVLHDWANTAMALFGAIRETECQRSEDYHAIAVPDTGPYRKTLGPLESFMTRQGVLMLWVQADGEVLLSGATERMDRILDARLHEG